MIYSMEFYSTSPASLSKPGLYGASRTLRSFTVSAMVLATEKRSRIGFEKLRAHGMGAGERFINSYQKRRKVWF